MWFHELNFLWIRLRNVFLFVMETYNLFFSQRRKGITMLFIILKLLKVLSFKKFT
jgi:hypothetical protein